METLNRVRLSKDLEVRGDTHRALHSDYSGLEAFLVSSFHHSPVTPRHNDHNSTRTRDIARWQVAARCPSWTRRA
jgi:hypothetical protein